MAEEKSHLGKYEILDVIGRGGFATVNKARDTRLDRIVALKTPYPQYNNDSSFAKRFSREARAAASLRHFNIITIYEADEIDGQYYIAMEYLSGQTLQEYIEQQPLLALEKALPILQQLADALDYAHKKGILHRDLKPANIFIEEKKSGPKATLLDFGLVKALEESSVLTSQGTVLGSVEYMAPEQSDPDLKHKMGPATDLYALGIITYQMLTGRVPFPGNTPSTLYAHIHKMPRNPAEIREDLSPGVAAALLKMLEKEPSNRFESATAFVNQLSTAIQNKQQEEQENQLQTLYSTLQTLINQQNWIEAFTLGSKIQALAPDYKDVSVLLEKSKKQIRDVQLSTRISPSKVNYTAQKQAPIVPPAYQQQEPNIEHQEVPTSPKIQTTAAKLTDVGKVRDHNEDYVDICIPEEQLQIQQKGSLYIVADGLGGNKAGEVASQRAVEVIKQFYYTAPPHLNTEEQPDLAATLRHAIEKANADVHVLSEQSLARKGMGTTVVAAVVRDNEVHIANVGNSRAYLLRNGNLHQITKDHTFVQEQFDAGILTEEEARVHPQRNAITRALGHKSQVQVDTFRGNLAPGDVLLLCSDGVSEPVQDKVIETILRKLPPEQAVTQLINTANAAGSPDNISAIVIKAQSYSYGKPSAIELAPETLPVATPVKRLPNTPPPPKEIPPKKETNNWLAITAAVIALVTFTFIIGNRLLGHNQTQPTPTDITTITETPTIMKTPTPESTLPVEKEEQPSPTLTNTPEPLPPVTKTPRLTLTATKTPENPTSTPKYENVSTPIPTTKPTNTSISSCVPQLPVLIEPADESTHIAWTNVSFRWEGGQRCKENQVWQITFDGQVGICPATTDNQVICQLILQPGEHIWRIEIWENGTPITLDSGRRIYIVSSPDRTDSDDSSGGDTGGGTGSDPGPGDKE